MNNGKPEIGDIVNDVEYWNKIKTLHFDKNIIDWMNNHVAVYKEGGIWAIEYNNRIFYSFCSKLEAIYEAIKIAKKNNTFVVYEWTRYEPEYQTSDFEDECFLKENGLTPNENNDQ